MGLQQTARRNSHDLPKKRKAAEGCIDLTENSASFHVGTFKRQKKSREVPRRVSTGGDANTPKETEVSGEQVKLSLSSFAWQYVVQLILSRPLAEVPPELMALAKEKHRPLGEVKQPARPPQRSAATAPQAKSEDKENMSERLPAAKSQKEHPTTKNTISIKSVAASAQSTKPRDPKAKDSAKPSSKKTCYTSKVNPADIGEDLRPWFRPFRIGKDALVGKPIHIGSRHKDGWSEATCASTGGKIHFQICRDAGDQDILRPIQQNHAYLIGRSFADKTQRQDYSEEDANLTQAILHEEDTLSFSVWAFGSRRAKEKTLAGTAVITRAAVDKHPNVSVFVLSLIAVDRQWRQYGVGRNLLERVERELRETERGDLILAHGLRPSFYSKNGYKLNPRNLPCPFKPKDRKVNFFCKELNPNISLSIFKQPKPTRIDLCSEHLGQCYSDYQPASSKQIACDRNTTRTTRSRSSSDGGPNQNARGGQRGQSKERASKPKVQETQSETGHNPSGRRLRTRCA